MMQKQANSLREQVNKSLTDTTIFINQQLSNMTTNLNQRLGDVTSQLQTTTGHIGKSLASTSKVVEGVRESLGELSQATKNVFEVGKDISSLQDILRSPKIRGGLGELLLDHLLEMIFPKKYYELQYEFKTGEKVDAVVKLAKNLLPIDAKFPLENFKKFIECKTDEERKKIRRKFIRDVKNHIDDISEKYILPDEDTYDFALMYIPAENVYYETIIKDEAIKDKSISSYALQKRVIPVSPNSFYAYLQVIVLGLKGLSIEKSAKQIIQNLARLETDILKFRSTFDVVGKHIKNTKIKYEKADRELGRFEDKLKSTSTVEVIESADTLALEEKTKG